jgi:hypothetical protein
MLADHPTRRERKLMNALRHSTWMFLILGAVAGCAGDTDTTETTTSPSPAPATSPPGPAKRPSDMTKAPGTGEMKPPPSAPEKPAEGKKGDEPPKVEGPKAETDKPDSKAVKLTSEEEEAIKELPAAEQAAAMAQGVCPVSAENLGSMGKPLKITAEGRTFYLCCKQCQKAVRDNPKAVIAKLDKKGK